MPASRWMIATNFSTDGWYQLHNVSPLIDGAWVAGGDVALQQPCACGPNCVKFETADDVEDLDITDCNVAFKADTLVDIFFLPDEESNIFGSTTAGDDAAGLALARTDDGWIGFDPGIAQAGFEGMQRLRWVREDLVSISGSQCGDLPTYTTVDSLDEDSE
jgi:hypothetical protein